MGSTLAWRRTPGVAEHQHREKRDPKVHHRVQAPQVVHGDAGRLREVLPARHHAAGLDERHNVAQVDQVHLLDHLLELRAPGRFPVVVIGLLVDAVIRDDLVALALRLLGQRLGRRGARVLLRVHLLRRGQLRLRRLVAHWRFGRRGGRLRDQTSKRVEGQSGRANLDRCG